MRVEVDGLDRVMAAPMAAERILGAVPQRIQRVVAGFVAAEKSGHRYTNRTGAAEASTRVRPRADGVDAEMAVPYAGVLNNRGWSGFQDLMDSAEGEVLAMIDEASSKL